MEGNARIGCEQTSPSTATTSEAAVGAGKKRKEKRQQPSSMEKMERKTQTAQKEKKAEKRAPANVIAVQPEREHFSKKTSKISVRDLPSQLAILPPRLLPVTIPRSN